MTRRSQAGRLARLPAALALRGVVAARSRKWSPRSRLFVVGDRIGWSTDDDVAQLTLIAERLGVAVERSDWAVHARRQAVFLPSHFSALQPRWLESSHRLGLAYFHGRPGTDGHPEFDTALDRLRAHAARVDRVQVTHAEMHELVVAAGVGEDRVFRIPIGIDLERFPLGDDETRAEARRALALPDGAFVVGSFQKDGVGWGDGLEPKLIKGPDVLVDVLGRVHAQAPDLLVLLTGPARGWVRRELERRGLDYRHLRVDSRADLARAYHALDVCLVASRQEGGPKSALEALATGAALVSTRVGQVPELAVDGRSALLADVDDREALVEQVLRAREDRGLARTLRVEGRRTAERYSYRRLDGAWAALFEGFVSRAAPSSSTVAHSFAIEDANDA